jgi:hypothetical protein
MNPDRPIRSSKILRSAKGQPCSANFPGICNGDPETTVFAHLNGHAFGKGMGIKAHDVLGFYACSACHAAYDLGHGTKGWLAGDMHKLVLDAVCTTWVRLIRANIIIVPLDPEHLSHDKPVKPRKPRGDRIPIPSRPMPPTGRKLASRPMRKAPTT